MVNTLTADKGSVYVCFIHDFETTDPESWFKHKLSIPHEDQGTTVCIYCKKPVKFDGIKQENMEYLVPAKCYYCAAKNEAKFNAKLVFVKQRPNRDLEDCRGD